MTEFRRAFHGRVRRAFHRRVALAYHARFPSANTFPFANSALYEHVPVLAAFSMTAAVTTSSYILSLSPPAGPPRLRSCRGRQFPRRTVAGNPNAPGKQKWRQWRQAQAPTRISRKARDETGTTRRDATRRDATRNVVPASPALVIETITRRQSGR